VGIRQEHNEHCSAYFAAYNSVTNSANKTLEHRLTGKIKLFDQNCRI